jgi:hypothetical protein
MNTMLATDPKINAENGFLNIELDPELIVRRN